MMKIVIIAAILALIVEVCSYTPQEKDEIWHAYKVQDN